MCPADGTNLCSDPRYYKATSQVRDWRDPGANHTGTYSSIHRVVAVFFSTHVVTNCLHRALHKLFTFLTSQQEGSMIRHLFRQNEMNRLLQDCRMGLKHAVDVFKVSLFTMK